MKRLLVLSNEPFSEGSSNGRTMMNLLLEYERSKIAQFYIHGTPDRTFCQNYFCVSDRDALNAFLHRPTAKSSHQQNAEDGSPQAKSTEGQAATKMPVRKIRRSCRNLLLRDAVWSSLAWWNKAFDDFLDEFSPEVILLQAGDAPFMFRIARKIAKRFGVPLVMYNSENYVLKQYMYNGAQQQKFWHALLMHRLKTEYRRFMKQVNFCIYSMDQLEEDYQQVYPHIGKSTVLYTVSDLKPRTAAAHTEQPFRVVYCGNLGVGRITPLVEFARILHEVDNEAVFDVYGRFVSKADKDLLCEVPGVDYHGVVAYEVVPDILRQADMVMHCENKERLVNLRVAFSTKIADSLAVGTPFVVYADLEYPFVKYLLRNRCAHIAGDAEELKTVLHKCRSDLTYRYQFVENALLTAAENHSTESNCRKFHAIMETI